MAAVDIEGVRKLFDQVTVLDGIDLAIADREFVVLVGESGCGKSTLLRVIAGLDHATAGEIRIGGRRVNELEPRDRDIAMVFQSYALYPHMNVAGNMGFNLELRKRGRDEIRTKVDAAAGVLNLDTLLARFPRQLSGGQRQRVAMGRAIVRQPQVFLFDEPLSNLDAKLRVQMRTEIRALHQRLAATSIYVTHDQIEAMTMADRIVVLNAGRIEQVGTPLELYDRPATRFVAGFIGSPAMNLADGTVVRAADAVALHTDSGARWPLPAAAQPFVGARATLGVRPEALGLDEHGALEGRVTVIERLGPLSYVFVDTGGVRVCCQADRHVAHRPGDAVRLSPVASMVHLFDKATGHRMSLD
jgi:multiple sugar transport system ATP-binding protein